MRRYHKEVYTEPEHWQRLEALTRVLNGLNWRYSGHCLEHLKSRAIDMAGALTYIRGITLKAEQIFEYYLTEAREPEKICYRIPYISGLDLVLVLSRDKCIITIYLNSREDRHETLKKEIYING